MEGICFAELNSSAGEVGQNLVGVMSAYLGCLFPGFITFLLPRVLGKVSGLSLSVAVRDPRTSVQSLSRTAHFLHLPLL